MSKPERRLGRGLDSLVSNLRPELERLPSRDPQPFRDERKTEQNLAGSDANGSDRSTGTVGAAMVAIRDLVPNPYQPRDKITNDDVVSISNSMRRHGLLQPISVRAMGGQYQIIAGERRWRAATSIGLTHVPVIVRQATDEQMLELALIENLEREDLNAMDRARAYRRFCTQFGLKPEEVADRLGEDRSTVANYLRLLDLAEPIQAMVAAGKLSMGHARCLLGELSEVHRAQLAEAIVANELSVRAVEEIVRRRKGLQAGATDVALLGSDGKKPAVGRLRSAHLRDLEERFERAVKTKVSIHEGRRKGSGRITIEYYSLDDFDRVASKLGVEAE